MHLRRRRSVTSACLLTAVLALGVATRADAAPAGPVGDNRGVSDVYETPNPPATPGEPVVSLTFDDGPHPDFTPQILAILQRYGVRATFFQLGSMAERYPDLVQQVIAQGHVVANHTWGHPDLRPLTDERFIFEVDHTTEVLESLSGQAMTCVRPPYGKADARTVGRLADRGLASVVWTADSRDFSKPGAGTIVESALLGLRPGSVILLHDGGGDRAQTIEALPAIIERILAAGYRIEPICGPGHQVPFGSVDGAAGARGRIKVLGWAADRDTADPITVDIYVDGMNSGTFTADRARDDLADVGLDPAHGFAATLRARPGPHEVCVFGINVGEGVTNPLLGCASVEVPPLTAIDDLRPFVAQLRWSQILEQVQIVEQVSQVHAARRAPWRLIGPEPVSAVPASGG